MELPNAVNASITESKLRTYLLNLSHEDGWSKARLFLALGYSQQNWQQLATDLREQHLTQEAVEVRPNDFGRKWEIVALLRGPQGTAMIKSIWIIPYGTEIPQLVTAYGA